MKSGVPNRIATKMADEWSASLTEDMGDLDPRIAEIEAANMAKHYHRWHVERLGTMTSPRPDGVFRILGENSIAPHPQKLEVGKSKT